MLKSAREFIAFEESRMQVGPVVARRDRRKRGVRIAQRLGRRAGVKLADYCKLWVNLGVERRLSYIVPVAGMQLPCTAQWCMPGLSECNPRAPDFTHGYYKNQL
jgi:hypothetical protein